MLCKVLLHACYTMISDLLHD